MSRAAPALRAAVRAGAVRQEVNNIGSTAAGRAGVCASPRASASAFAAFSTAASAVAPATAAGVAPAPEPAAAATAAAPPSPAPAAMVDAGRHGSFAVTHAPAEAAAGGEEVGLLLGWALSTDRQTRHYAGLLHELGVGTVLRATAGTYDTFFSRPGRRRLAEEALDALAEHAARHPGRPAWLFLMSNGGAFVYEEMLDALRRDGSDGTGGGGGAAGAAPGARRWGGVRLAGAVFDSAPAALTVRSASLGMTEFIRTPALRSLAYAAAVALHSTVLPPAPHNDAFFAALRADALPLPALYIYSDDDVVTDAATLTEFVAWRRARHPLGPQRGVAELHITEPSAHVSHYRSHKARYVAAVRDFLATARDGFASREGVSGSGGSGGSPDGAIVTGVSVKS